MKREQILLSTMSDAQLDHAQKLLKREHSRRANMVLASKSKRSGTRKTTGRRAAAAA